MLYVTIHAKWHSNDCGVYFVMVRIENMVNYFDKIIRNGYKDHKCRI